MEKNATVDLQWLLDDFVERVGAVDRAVVLSGDGLLVGRSSSLSAEDGEHLSAVASAFHGLARGAARQFEGGGVRQTMVEMDNAYLFVIAAGRGACLAVLAAENGDLGVIAYEMNILLKRVGTHMAAEPRVVSGDGSAGAHTP